MSPVECMECLSICAVKFSCLCLLALTYVERHQHSSSSPVLVNGQERQCWGVHSMQDSPLLLKYMYSSRNVSSNTRRQKCRGCTEVCKHLLDGELVLS